MKKFFFPLLTFLLVFSLTGCLSDAPMDVAIDFINVLYSKSENGKPTPEERFVAIESLVTAERKKKLNQNKELFQQVMKEAATKGLFQPYFVAEDPSEPITETYSVVLVKLPKKSFAEPPTSLEEENYYLKIILRKEDGDWKVDDMKDLEKSDLPNEEEIDWKEVDPL